MRKEDFYGEDGLRRYVDSSGIEKAPEGFSSKVMSHVYMEKKPVKAEKNYRVLLIFGVFFLMLSIVAVFIPDNELSLPDLKFPENFNFSFPELSSGVIIPQIVIYIVAGLVLLAVFDSGLHLLFRREQKNL